ILIVLACALCLLPAYASAQTCCVAPKDEIFGGYSWLAPNGYGDLNFKVQDIADGFDISNTFYLPSAHNFGFMVDGSGSFHGHISPPNPTGGMTGSAAGYVLGGLQYKFHTDRVSPFVRAFVGGA